MKLITNLLSFRDFKNLRLRAMSETISAYHGSSERHRSAKLAICLIIVLVWQINALNSRPAGGQHYRAIEELIYPQQRNDDGDLEFCIPWGITFISQIVTGTASPRLANDMTLSPHVVEALTKGKISYETVEFRHAPVMARQPKSKTIDIHNRQPITPAIEVPEDVEQFDVEAVGAILPNENPDSDDDDGSNAGLNEQITALWSQFLSDLLIKAPNPRRGVTRYCHLEIWEKETAGERAFKNPNLATVWNIVAWRKASPREWSMVFNYFFPQEIPDYAPSTQNYTQCRWLQQWGKMLTKMNYNSIKITRDALRRSFDQLLWIPAAQSGRIWDTKAHSSFTRYPPDNSNSWVAPKIFINPALWRPDYVIFTPVTNTQQNNQDEHE